MYRYKGQPCTWNSTFLTQIANYHTFFCLPVSCHQIGYTWTFSLSEVKCRQTYVSHFQIVHPPSHGSLLTKCCSGSDLGVLTSRLGLAQRRDIVWTRLSIISMRNHLARNHYIKNNSNSTQISKSLYNCVINISTRDENLTFESSVLRLWGSRCCWKDG